MQFKQNQNKYNEFLSFPEAVEQHLEEKNMTHGDLTRASQLSRTTISRIFRNENDKGSTYKPSPEVVMAICVALRLDEDETEEMFFVAYPEWKCWKEISRRKLSMNQANELLYDSGLSTLGNSNEQ